MAALSCSGKLGIRLRYYILISNWCLADIGSASYLVGANSSMSSSELILLLREEDDPEEACLFHDARSAALRVLTIFEKVVEGVLGPRTLPGARGGGS